MQTAPNNRALSAMQYSDPERFVRQCHAAVKKHKGHRARAAQELRVTTRTLLRWCAKYPTILDGIDGMYKPTKEEVVVRTSKRMRTLRRQGRSRPS